MSFLARRIRQNDRTAASQRLRLLKETNVKDYEALHIRWSDKGTTDKTSLFLVKLHILNILDFTNIRVGVGG